MGLFRRGKKEAERRVRPKRKTKTYTLRDRDGNETSKVYDEEDITAVQELVKKQREELRASMNESRDEIAEGMITLNGYMPPPTCEEESDVG